MFMCFWSGAAGFGPCLNLRWPLRGAGLYEGHSLGRFVNWQLGIENRGLMTRIWRVINMHGHRRVSGTLPS